MNFTERMVKKMATVKVSIVCPCGKLLTTKNVNPTGKASGSVGCPSCRKRVAWQISNGQCHVTAK